MNIFPKAVTPKLVGKYSALVRSGGGFFWDEVLEYRVWVHPGNGKEDFFKAFADYPSALHYHMTTEHAEEPLVLVRQKEWIDEPYDGVYHHKKGDRITEWQVKWLKDKKRGLGSIARFLKEKEKEKKA